MKHIPLGPLIIDISDKVLNQEDLQILTHPLIGGVILFARNYENKAQVTALIRQIKLLRSPELLVCVDQEGGRVQRFKNDFTHLPPLNTLGKLYDRDQQKALESSRLLARIMAHELKPTGVDFSFAPVLDVCDPQSQIIADRAFHHDHNVITELAMAYIQGLHDIGMIAVGKHFPGHGGVHEDSHLCLPNDLRCFKDLEEKDMMPYSRLINHGLDALMSAHVLFTHIDALPSGFSGFWINEILRKKLNFNGIIFTDDLSMRGAIEFGTIIDRTRLALEAGCDMALICNDRPAVINVLDAKELQSHINPVKDFSVYCRKTPQHPDWQPQALQVKHLIASLEDLV